MIIYKAHFKDENHDLDIDIVNSESGYDSLSFEIDGVRFIGNPFDFELYEPEKNDVDALPFAILKDGGNTRSDGTKSGYYYCLQRYELEITIPVKIVRRCDNMDMGAYIRIKYASRQRIETDKRSNVICLCDDKVIVPDIVDISEFSLNIDDEVYHGKNVADFESALISIYKLIKDKYEMFCCLTCQYSDYSPYGNSDFGTMLCYRRYKAEYLKVNSKDEFFEYLSDLKAEFMQETQLCKEYAPRTLCSGYRGYISDYF